MGTCLPKIWRLFALHKNSRTNMSATPRVITFVAEWGSPEHYWLPGLYIQGVTPLNPGNPVAGTLYDAWCLVKNISLPIEATYTANIYSSYELGSLAAVPGLATSINHDSLFEIAGTVGPLPAAKDGEVLIGKVV
eukprot:TRINITY_DN1430_c1_g1_i1.p1 TRINITY_DN1430_c1_g1~~TRINITY_DN1430_c1_g1_i1.p1  ORF type:complete len:135 (-),score=6.32 TRINITY_DN1430_c1_g1_i1:27-431(-)